jgi:hypothetical protein
MSVSLSPCFEFPPSLSAPGHTLIFSPCSLSLSFWLWLYLLSISVSSSPLLLSLSRTHTNTHALSLFLVHHSSWHCVLVGTRCRADGGEHVWPEEVLFACLNTGPDLLLWGRHRRGDHPVEDRHERSKAVVDDVVVLSEREENQSHTHTSSSRIFLGQTLKASAILDSLS